MIGTFGYQICANPSCKTAVLGVVSHATGGFCEHCATTGVAERLRELKVAVGGGVITLERVQTPQTARNRRKYLRRKGRPDVKGRKHASEKAKRAAWRRLAAAAPELYALILADERQKRGLTPVSAHRALVARHGDQAWATLDALEFYRSLASEERAPDEPDHTA